MKANNLSEKMIVEKTNAYYFKPIVLSQDCLFCHGDPKGEKDVVGGVKEGWKAGEVHGAFVIISSLEKAQKKAAAAAWSVAGITLTLLVIIGWTVWVLIRKNVLYPLNRFEAVVHAVASGDMTQTVQMQSTDEFGVMAEGLETMRKELSAMVSAIKLKADHLTRSGKSLGDTSTILYSGAEETLGKSNSVAAAAEEMSASMNSVAAAVEQTSMNVMSVASAADQMIVTIEEISSRSEKANKSCDHGAKRLRSGG